ncbi:MAG TPA: pyridoxal phosphate-dependent aminotransferase [Longimicrobiales bacterium]|nr:pyridoxal phosphate-dependent aminotransferase [Longimicrobiales bacterium]
MTFQKSDNVRELVPSATLAVAARAKELAAGGADIVDLSAGEPDFDTPVFASEAGIQAIRQGHTRYTAAAGLPELRRAIAQDLARASGVATDPAGVVVTAGAKQALFNAMFVLFGKGDRVVVPAPYWTSYPALVHLSRAEPLIVAGDPAQGFKMTPRILDSIDATGCAGIILNSPVNPTGAVYDERELRAVAEWALERGMWLIGDQIYGRLYHEGTRAPGLLDLGPDIAARSIVIDGASKLFAMTGWRIGFSYSEPAIAAAMGGVQSHMTSNAATPSQYAALAAYAEDPAGREEVRAMQRSFRARRDLVVRLFAELLPDLDFVEPRGAFYLFFRVDSHYDDAIPGSVALCARLLDEAGVALVPGEAFGDDRYVRMSYATSEAMIEEGIGRIARVLNASFQLSAISAQQKLKADS